MIDGDDKKDLTRAIEDSNNFVKNVMKVNIVGYVVVNCIY